MVVSADKCPVYRSSANGRPLPTARAGRLKNGAEIHVLEELSESKCTWLRCKQGWLPLTDESGKRMLRVLHEEGVLQTPSGREVVDAREGCVQAVMETLESNSGEMATAWSTASAPRDELVLTFVTPGQLGFDLDKSYSRVLSINANADAPICTDLQVGMTLRAVQGTEVAGLSSTQMRRLWSSTAHRRPLALSFALSTGYRPATQWPHANETIACSASAVSSSCRGSDTGGIELRRIGGKIAELSTTSEAQLCARAAEAAMKEDMANAKLGTKRWTQLNSSLAEVGWITWSVAKTLGIAGGENLVGKRVAVLGNGFGTVQSYEGARRFGSSGTHYISFENRCSVKPVKLEKKNGSRWLLFNPDESLAGADKDVHKPPQAPPPTPVPATQPLQSPVSLTLSPDTREGPMLRPTDMVRTEDESTPKGSDCPLAETPSSTFKILLD